MDEVARAAASPAVIGDHLPPVSQLGAVGRPAAAARRRVGVLAADYALGQPDPRGVLAELVAALGLTAAGAAADGRERCVVCAEPVPHWRDGPATRTTCSIACNAARRSAL